MKKIIKPTKTYSKRCSVMKEIIGKMYRHSKSKLPRKLFVGNKYITLEKEIE